MCPTQKPVKIYCPPPIKPSSFDPASQQGRAQGVNDIILYSLGLEKTVKCYEDTIIGVK